MADEGAVSLEKLKVAELKKELAEHGLSMKGNKPELVSRLDQYLRQHEGVAVHKDNLAESIAEVNEDDEINDLEDDKGDDVTLLLEKGDKEELIKTTEHIANEEVSDDVAKSITEANPKENCQTGNDKVLLHLNPGQVPSKAVSEDEKKIERLKRFGGNLSEKDKKLQRAHRFGTGGAENLTSSKAFSASSVVEQRLNKDLDIDKLKKRAERFGTVSPAIKKVEESDRLTKRKERFGIATAGLVTQGQDAKKQKRAERFGIQ